MPMWRCPHCGTPQAETARCWVCRRSSTACLTCRNFRGSVAANVGYCGLDRRRTPLNGDEIRACWEGGTFTMAPTIPAARARLAVIDGTPVQRIEFVEVSGGAATEGSGPGSPSAGDLAADPAHPIAADEPRWSLWEDSTV